MSEHEVDESPEPMSDALRQYVDAFAAIERPAPGMEVSTWSAIAAQVRPSRTRAIAVGVSAAVAIAAAVLLAVSGVGGALLHQSEPAPSVQAPSQGAPDETGGELTPRDPKAGVARRSHDSGRSAADAPLAADDAAPIEPAPEPESESESESTTGAERPRTTPRKTETPKPTLSDELVLFKRAKRALDAGDAGDALSLLDEHRTTFPKGALLREGTVLQAQALCALGRKAEAVKLRDRFLAAHASSPLAARMRDVCR